MFLKNQILIKPQFVVPCDGFGLFENLIFNCFFVRNYALSPCKCFDYVQIRFNVYVGKVTIKLIEGK